MSGKKVLMLGWELAPMMSGGLGVVCRELGEALVNKGLQLSFVIPRLPITDKLPGFKIIDLNKFAQENEIQIRLDHEISSYSGVTKQVHKTKYLEKGFSNELYGNDLLAEVENFSALVIEAVRDSTFDIIHAHDWMTAKAAINLKQLFGKPYIFHIHSTEFDRTANNPNPMILNHEKKGLQEADLIIAVSNYTKEILINRYRIPASKIKVVYNAVNNKVPIHNNIKKPPNFKTVLFLARLSVQKGADYLLKAAQKVLEKRKNVRFIIVGQGDQLENLIDLSFELGISDNVVFTGALTHEEVDKAYKFADLFVMPSVSEPFGITSLEAIRNGTPVIISKQSGASEVLKNCLKVDFWDIDQMASKILAVIDNNVLSTTLSSNGYKDLCNLTWPEQAEKIIAIYNSFNNIRE